MDLAVGPSPEQRHGGIDAVVLAVATIVDIRKHALVFGLCGRGVLAHAHADADLRAVVIAHGHLHRAVGLIAAAQLIGRGRPSGVARCRTVSHDAVALLREPFLLTVADTGTKAVGHVDKSAVGPSRAPRVGDDPRTVFIVAKMVTGLSGYAVTVHVELYAVVIAHDHQCVVSASGVPSLHKHLASHAPIFLFVSVLGMRPCLLCEMPQPV